MNVMMEKESHFSQCILKFGKVKRGQATKAHGKPSNALFNLEVAISGRGPFKTTSLQSDSDHVPSSSLRFRKPLVSTLLIVVNKIGNASSWLNQTR
ncbi:hypothetical protein AVEN_215791-1 [Araneus ventricosus]|uniref:Uncharacterized protein n=1 Tax=Araneus ventricosus TaxID=182803 RepID=A0A4Y2J4X8_ARAVE|nr:hypothetical protein AVEN_215791-1 [Araneus ventricosus]